MLQSWSMQRKLIGALSVMSVVALIAIGWFSLRAITEARGQADAAAAAAEVVELAVVTGDLVHQLQLERGMSVGFVASGGTNFASELPPGRTATDDSLAELRHYLDVEAQGLDAEVVSLVTRGADAAAALDTTRAGIDGLQLAGGEVAATFTATIADLLDGVEVGLAGIDEAELLREGAAYAALLEAKEAAGQQRAQLNAVFTADGFTTAQLALVGGLMGQQEALLGDFEVYASPDVRDRFRSHAGSTTFATVADLEESAFDRSLTGGFGITPGEWFDASTARIDLLHDVELQQAQHMRDRATTLSTAAARGAWTDTALSLVSLVLLVGIALAVIVWVRRGVIRPLTHNAEALAGSSEDMSAVATQVGSNAEETSAQAGVVASAGEQVSQSVQAVATAVEELTSSIGEIAQNATEATGVANEAVGVADETNTTITELGEASAEIGRVIELITSIAEQTNLLALNATIEAARAGDAGKGFAVVANEVKDLANQTAEATDEVSKRIQAIQDGTAGAVTAIGRISEVVGRISDLQTTIASAVEEQSSATNEIARSVNEAAQGSSEIASNITSVATAASDTTDGATRTQAAAGELATMAASLDRLVFGHRSNPGSHGTVGAGGTSPSPTPVAPPRPPAAADDAAGCPVSGAPETQDRDDEPALSRV